MAKLTLDMPLISGSARLAGVLGWPVAHSRSPRLHGYWLQRYRIDGVYVPLATRPEDFANAIAGLRAMGFAGANVTIPHKQAAFALCDDVEPFATQAGAVNTLVIRDGRLIGSNTDGFGFLENLRAHGVDPGAGPALVLGAGGAGRAIAAALTAHARVTVTSRTAAHAETLAAQVPGLAVIPWAQRDAALRDHALVVNATAAGMEGHPPLAIDLSAASARLAVADIVYAPLETPLLRAARTAGLAAVEGLGMLLHQARAGFRAWFGVDPAVDEETRRIVADA